jgi:hypothetical protein
MDHKNWREFRYVELLDGLTRFLAMWTNPASYNFSVEIHVEAFADMTTVDVVWWQLQAEIGKSFICGTFICADRALDSAFNLSVEEPKNETFSSFRVFKPRSF